MERTRETDCVQMGATFSAFAFWMDLQITSTLNLLSQSVRDKGVQTHGMRYLIDCCSEGGCLYRLRRRSFRRRGVEVSGYSNPLYIDP